MTLLEKINKLGYSEYVNCYIVMNDIREAYLFQFVDYGEFKKMDLYQRK